MQNILKLYDRKVNCDQLFVAYLLYTSLRHSSEVFDPPAVWKGLMVPAQVSSLSLDKSPLIVKHVEVTDSQPACHEFQPSYSEDLPCREEMHLKSVEAQMSSRWYSVEVKRGGCQLRCRPRHLTMVQNYEVRRQKSPRVAEYCDVTIHTLTSRVESPPFSYVVT
ncbi:hypothetical protein TNCV_3769601 [Trichonephila clavipes]|nr:hypothetical protein TNCV_3769601 [Trichonephila clavipes]